MFEKEAFAAKAMAEMAILQRSILFQIMEYPLNKGSLLPEGEGQDEGGYSQGKLEHFFKAPSPQPSPRGRGGLLFEKEAFAAKTMAEMAILQRSILFQIMEYPLNKGSLLPQREGVCCRLMNPQWIDSLSLSMLSRMKLA